MNKKFILVLLMVLYLTSIIPGTALTVIKGGSSSSGCLIDRIDDTCGGGSGSISPNLNFQNTMRFITIELSFDEEFQYYPGTEFFVRIRIYALPDNWEILIEFNETLLEERRKVAFTSPSYEIRPDVPVEDLKPIILEKYVQHQFEITSEINISDNYIDKFLEFGYKSYIAVAENEAELVTVQQISLDQISIGLGLIIYVIIKKKHVNI